MGTMLIVVGVLMWLAESAGRRRAIWHRSTGPDAVVIGLARPSRWFPATSRSGITISAGLFRNLTRETAARFSFLLSAPAIAGAAGQGALGHA